MDVSAESTDAAALASRDSAVAFLDGHLHGGRLRRVALGAGGAGRAGGSWKALRAPTAAFRSERGGAGGLGAAAGPAAPPLPPVAVAPTGAASSRAFRRAATGGAQPPPGK